jgi:hypothetical protein
LEIGRSLEDGRMRRADRLRVADDRPTAAIEPFLAERFRRVPA